MKGFRDFILRGNVVDLAVGVVIGAAFATLVGAFGTAFLNPLIALALGNTKKDCSVVTDPVPGTNCSQGAGFTINNQFFGYGAFITAIIVFLITAAVIYFAVVLPLNTLMAKFKKPEEKAPEAKSDDVILLEEIRDLLAGATPPQADRAVRQAPSARPHPAT